MRAITVCAAALVLAAAPAQAQMPPETPPTVTLPATPATALAGTLTSVGSGRAVLQTEDGTSVTLRVSRGTLLVDPSPQALAAGMRVFVHGFAHADGVVDAQEIDVLVPPNLMLR
ncbi:MAG: hypothetical protein JO359_00290 [Candidatus Eremiobacteraeota bacterium]|nr:hypothetical protein [Candidatus Eremiobacteraeota bacterium]